MAAQWHMRLKVKNGSKKKIKGLTINGLLLLLECNINKLQYDKWQSKKCICFANINYRLGEIHLFASVYWTAHKTLLHVSCSLKLRRDFLMPDDFLERSSDWLGQKSNCVVFLYCFKPSAADFFLFYWQKQDFSHSFLLISQHFYTFLHSFSFLHEGESKGWVVVVVVVSSLTGNRVTPCIHFSYLNLRAAKTQFSALCRLHF